MSKIKPGRAFAKEIFNTFSGLSTDGADEMRNFRILEDGSLEKRCGYETTDTLPGIIRGLWQGPLDGSNRFFAVCDNGVYTKSDGGGFERISSVSTTQGRVHFFLYNSLLYLTDGEELYVLLKENTGFTIAQGYAPLYGVNWHPTDYGDVNEDMNLLNNHLRIHYRNSISTLSFVLPYYASSIDEVRLDGTRDTDFSYSMSGKTVTVSRMASNIDISFTVSLTNEHTQYLKAALHKLVGRSEEREYLLLAGGGAGGRYVYCSSPVSAGSLSGSLVRYRNSDPLYFVTENILTVGDESHPVTGFLPENDRVLAFWAHGASSISVAPEGHGTEGYPLPLGMGCTLSDPGISVDGDPIVVNEGGIFRLHAAPSEPDRFYPTRLADPPDFWQSASFRENGICIADSAHGEIWFRDPTDTDGLVWVWSPEKKQWYCFDNIRASLFFSQNGRVGFAERSSIAWFSEDLTTDDGAPFEAVYRSAYLCFSSPESVKRSLRVTLCGFGAEASLELESERRSRRFYLLSDASELPVCLDKRARFGRFRHLRFCLRDSGSERSRWSRLALYSNL